MLMTMMMLMLLLLEMMLMLMMMLIMMVMMIPKESQDLVSWKVGEEGFIFRERGPQQFHWLN